MNKLAVEIVCQITKCVAGSSAPTPHLIFLTEMPESASVRLLQLVVSIPNRVVVKWDLKTVGMASHIRPITLTIVCIYIDVNAFHLGDFLIGTYPLCIAYVFRICNISPKIFIEIKMILRTLFNEVIL